MAELLKANNWRKPRCPLRKQLLGINIFHNDLSFVFCASSHSLICATSSVARKREEKNLVPTQLTETWTILHLLGSTTNCCFKYLRLKKWVYNSVDKPINKPSEMGYAKTKAIIQPTSSALKKCFARTTMVPFPNFATAFNLPLSTSSW